MVTEIRERVGDSRLKESAGSLNDLMVTNEVGDAFVLRVKSSDMSRTAWENAIKT